MTAIIASIVYKTIVDGKWEKLIRFEIGRLAERIAVQRGEKKKKKKEPHVQLVATCANRFLI